MLLTTIGTTMIFTNVLVLDLSCGSVFVFLSLSVCVYMYRSRVDEPSGFRVFGFVRCPRRFLTINETSLSLWPWAKNLRQMSRVFLEG